MKHIEIISKARQKEYLQQAALEEYGPDLHVALRSRRDELLYLRKLTEILFPYILPPKATDCRSLTLLIREVLAGSVFLPSMDYLADPDTANHLILIFIDNSPPEEATEPTSTLVPFLQKYSDTRSKKPSVLKLELKEIREQQDLLFRFMNFLKQEGAVHVLQFCLAVGKYSIFFSKLLVVVNSCCYLNYSVLSVNSFSSPHLKLSGKITTHGWQS
uniref:PXA domain-containing protein n=1 Tax=Oreochromis aureus TaxID=47969 RepID=A0AAZ1XD27_OREAU